MNMIRIKIKNKKEHKQSIIGSSPDTHQIFHPAGEPGGSGVPMMNTMEECGADYPVDEYGKSQNSDPDMNQDGIYSPAELYYHFDLNGDGTVVPDEYEQHVKWHSRHPEVFDDQDDEQLYLPESFLSEKKDRCYRLAKQKYDVFPSAYASGFIVRCRKGKVAKKKKK